MVVETIGATRDIRYEGGCGRLMMTSIDTSDGRCEGYNISLDSDRRMMTSGDTLGERVRATKKSLAPKPI